MVTDLLVYMYKMNCAISTIISKRVRDSSITNNRRKKNLTCQQEAREYYSGI